ncbi:MAG TPA: alpha/beta family hydrolase [Terriglobales bacterium]|nr:alpha/beta family hydrolase [Terriglobales bacterium]
MIPEQPVRLSAAPGVTLDARVALPPGAVAGVALCHPHPLYGGDMENPVVVRAAEVVRETGLATLRFDFRGVGASTGTHADGKGEQDDLMAAVDHLAGVLGAGARVAVCGYSFGAAVAGRVALRRPVAGVALIAPALAMAPLADLADLARFDGPVLLVAGTADTYCPVDALEALGRAIPRATVRTVAGADHFFFGKLFPLGELIAAWAREVTG